MVATRMGKSFDDRGRPGKHRPGAQNPDRRRRLGRSATRAVRPVRLARKAGRAVTFDELFAEVTGEHGRFDHAAHLHLTWLAVRHAGMPVAIALVSDGIRRTARYAGAPQKYHATVSRAWVELVAHHVAEDPRLGFAAFTATNPALLDKRLLTRFYRPATLAAPAARTGWLEPDLTPFPWPAAA
jgi:hypothetical protein